MRSTSLRVLIPNGCGVEWESERNVKSSGRLGTEDGGSRFVVRMLNKCGTKSGGGGRGAAFGLSPQSSRGDDAQHGVMRASPIGPPE